MRAGRNIGGTRRVRDKEWSKYTTQVWHLKLIKKLKPTYIIIMKVIWNILKTEAKNVMKTVWPEFGELYVWPLF